MKKIFLLPVFVSSYLLCVAQNVGIGTATPLVKLHVTIGASGNTNPLGPLLVEGNYNTYINLLSPNANETGVLFGKASDAASGGIVYNNAGTLNGFQFRTNGNSTKMVVDLNGNVGIGNNNPAYQFDVSNRMRIRSGGNNSTTAGLWLNNNANTEAAFIGMEDDTHVGFYGTGGAGWRFGMNTQTGALKINGSEGQAGQTLISNGPAAPSWSSVSSWLFNNIYQRNQISNIVIPPVPATPTLPGLNYTDFSLTIISNSKLIVSAFVNIKSLYCFGCGPSTVGLGIQILQNGFTFPGSNSANSEGSVDNDHTLTFTTGLRIVDVTPAVYTFRTFVFNDVGPSANAECSSGRLFIAVIPQ